MLSCYFCSLSFSVCLFLSFPASQYFCLQCWSYLVFWGFKPLSSSLSQIQLLVSATQLSDGQLSVPSSRFLDGLMTNGHPSTPPRSPTSLFIVITRGNTTFGIYQHHSSWLSPLAFHLTSLTRDIILYLRDKIFLFPYSLPTQQHFLQCSEVSPLCASHILPPFWIYLSPTPPHPTHLGRHRAPSWAPRQQVPTSSLFYAWQCIYVNPKLPVHRTLLPGSESTHRFSASASLFLPTNRFICTIFLDSTYMR